MYQLKIAYLRRVSTLLLVFVLGLTVFTGCGSSRKEESIQTVDGFLSTAESGDLTGAGAYTTEEVMTQLEWTDASFNAVKDNFYNSISGYGDITVDELKANPEISGAVDGFVEKLKHAMVTSYVINQDTYAQKDEEYQIVATVNTVSEDDIKNLMSGEIVDKVTAFATEYMTAHASELSKAKEKEVYTNLYKELVPYTMDALGKEVDKVAGSKEELWGFTLADKEGKLIITGIYDANPEDQKQ